jgi:hypothetical protein
MAISSGRCWVNIPHFSNDSPIAWMGLFVFYMHPLATLSVFIIPKYHVKVCALFPSSFILSILQAHESKLFKRGGFLVPRAIVGFMYPAKSPDNNPFIFHGLPPL